MSERCFFRLTLASIFGAVLIAGLLVVPAQAQITPTTVYGFPGQPGPSNPNIEAIAQGRNGNLYLTGAGGEGKAVNCTTTYCGEAFRMTTSGTVNDVFDFSNNSCPGSFCGYGAYGGLTLGTDGNFYGATYYGGTSSHGALFKLTPAGVMTSLYEFTGGTDGSDPYGSPIEGSNGIFYGTTTAAGGLDSTIYSVTSSGVFKTLYTFTGTDGQNVYAPLVQGTDGNFYGESVAGGANGYGTIFKMTPAGTLTVLHNFAGTDGSDAYYPLIQASDGNFYGEAYSGGTDGTGVIFKVTPSGTYTVLHNINGTTDGDGPAYGLVQATNGTMYGVTSNNNNQGVYLNGTIFSITTGGTFEVLYTFTGSTDGGIPLSPMRQHTDGLLYGTTEVGGDTNCYSAVSFNGQEVIVAGCGELFSLNIAAKPFVSLLPTSGKVGSMIGILGQGFSASSVVKFNGVQATAVTVSGTTFITATVPAGASDGFVTVTTGTTTLKSAQKYRVHNSWSSGTAIPTPINYPAGTGAIGTKIYVVGGGTASGDITTNQVYNTSTNAWSTEKALPAATAGGAAAVVKNILYIFGGYSGSENTPLDAVWAYNPTTNAWTAEANMPTARGSATAVVDGTTVYVIGGNGSTPRLGTVEAYDTVTNTWTEEAPLLTGKSDLAGGLLGTIVVAADGYNATTEDNGDNEAYDVSTNSWSALTADPQGRNSVCYGVASGLLYIAGGSNSTGSQVSENESYSLTGNKWTTLASEPQATIAPGSAVVGGQVYCISGSSSSLVGEGTLYNNVQIYQP
jgi:uncharacterized repeat protein (TIGR03803 family)